MYPNRNPAWKQALLIIDFQGNTRKGSSTSLSAWILYHRGVRRVNLFEQKIIPDGMYVIRIQSDDNRVFSAKIRIQSQ
jgi:hypothetical protein